MLVPGDFLWIKLSTSISISHLIAAYKSQQLINRLQKAQRLQTVRQTYRERESDREASKERERERPKVRGDTELTDHFFICVRVQVGIVDRTPQLSALLPLSQISEASAGLLTAEFRAGRDERGSFAAGSCPVLYACARP